MNQLTLHQFHIPVMGLSYTVDTPIKVARYGISSVIPIVEDRLLEMMRSYYYPTIDKPYTPISNKEVDYRAKRITDYLNLVNTIVNAQFEKLKHSAFEKGSEIVKYMEMLPQSSYISQLYSKLSNISDIVEKEKIESYIREHIKPGSIDVNIMTKVDRNTLDKNGHIIEDGSDGVTALSGFAKSELKNSSVVFSAGMNPRLYNYLEKCRQFDIKKDGSFDKKITIKVSDYRSALIQGKYLAKKGIWISEFRIESGLNCGGHAFATDGFLLGPILEEFKTKNEELKTELYNIYTKALAEKNVYTPSIVPLIKITVQGGIGTSEENDFLHQNYPIESTGWGTPFLLVPEATTLDNHTLELLRLAKEEDIELSRHSPLGVRFHYLKGTTAEKERLERIDKGKPGSACFEKHLSFNTEFTVEPICTASKQYQTLKIAQLQTLDLTKEEYELQYNQVIEKECLCVGLSNAASLKYETTFIKKNHAVNICPGPNIKYFDKVVSLHTMVDHIYGKVNIMDDTSRPNIFINELQLYIDYLKEQLLLEQSQLSNPKQRKYFSAFCNNLIDGISYYQNFKKDSFKEMEKFNSDLKTLFDELNDISNKFELVN